MPDSFSGRLEKYVGAFRMPLCVVTPLRAGKSLCPYLRCFDGTATPGVWICKGRISLICLVDVVAAFIIFVLVVSRCSRDLC